MLSGEGVQHSTSPSKRGPTAVYGYYVPGELIKQALPEPLRTALRPITWLINFQIAIGFLLFLLANEGQ